MKREFLRILLIAFLPLFAVSCIDNIPDEEDLPRDAVSFDYLIEGDYALDYYVGSEITFTSTSPETTVGEPTWNFGDDTDLVVGKEVKHRFKTAGTYNVKLTIGDFSKTQVILISDIKPIMTINPIEGGICEVNVSKVTFSLDVPNPEGLSIEYLWTLPEGTLNANGETIEISTDTLPGELIFSNVGTQTVRLQVKLGGRTLEEGTANVQVGYSEAVPTLYYAVQGGRLMAHKLIANAPKGMKVSSYDLGVASGQHPFNLLFKDSSLYVLDCGKQFYYVNDENGVLGDGKISVISKDGSKVETMISNAGGPAFQDPFYGCIDGDFLYYADRNTGIIKLPLNTRNAVWGATEYPYYVNHNTLGYYNNGWGYGCIGGMLGKIKGVWHWCKFYNGNGIYRFKDTDILSAAVAAGDDSNLPKDGIALSGMQPKSFAYSPVSDKIAFSIMDVGYGGVYLCTMAEFEAIGSSKANLKNYKLTYTPSKADQEAYPELKGKKNLEFVPNITGVPAAVEGTGSEAVGICQLAYDEVNNCVYFAFRNNVPDDTSAPTGIYACNVKKGEVTLLVPGVSVYGLTVNNTPSKLF